MNLSITLMGCKTTSSAINNELKFYLSYFWCLSQDISPLIINWVQFRLQIKKLLCKDFEKRPINFRKEFELGLTISTGSSSACLWLASTTPGQSDDSSRRKCCVRQCRRSRWHCWLVQLASPQALVKSKVSRGIPRGSSRSSRVWVFLKYLGSV